jgi:hypothetical protein
MEKTYEEKFLTREQVYEVVESKPQQYVVTREGKEPQTVRLFQNNGRIGYLPKRKRSRGFVFDTSRIVSLVPVNNAVKKEFTERERVIDTHKKIRNLIVKETHPNLWQELVAAQKRLTDSELERVADHAETLKGGFSGYNFWKALGELHPGTQWEGMYKRLSVRGTLPKYGDRNARIGAFSKAIEESKDKDPDWSFRDHWRTSYDYSVHITNGRAWFSEEYKDCGNGHYYLLLNANCAIFYEDD